MTLQLSQYFFPQESNNFRPKTIHSSALIFYITVIVTLQVGFNILSFIKPGVLGYATDISIGRLLELTNQKRNELGLKSLTLDQQLSRAAEAKANDMFTNNYWAHNSPTGKSPWDFILGSDYHYVYAGENLAKDFADSSGVVSTWMASLTHRDNIVNPKYQEIGFAVVNGKINGVETTLVVQMFGTKAPSSIAMLPVNEILSPTVTPVLNSINLNVVNLSPAPTIVSSLIVTPKEKKTSELSTLNLNSSSKTKPKINVFSITKEFSLSLTFILIVVLIIDAYVAIKDQQSRLTGDNIAHLGFLIILIVSVLITSVGMIM